MGKWHKRRADYLGEDDGRLKKLARAISDADKLDDRPRCMAERDQPQARMMPVTRKVVGRRVKLAKGMTADTGAADNVMPQRMFTKELKVRPSHASRRGVHEVAACSQRIRNEGEVDYPFQTKHGGRHTLTFQIPDVSKMLAAVMCVGGC